MLRSFYLSVCCLTLSTVGLSAAVDTSPDIQNHKARIITETSKVLSQAVKVSPNARSSKSCGCKKMKTSCGCITLIGPEDINPNGFVITSPGIYHLKNDTVFTPATTGLAAIVVDSNGVILDMCDKSLVQGNDVLGTVGILVNGESNVIVQNGTVKDFSWFGIRVAPESSYVTLKNLNAFGNGQPDAIGGGIAVTSAVPEDVTHDIVIENINASENFFVGLALSGVRNVDVINSKFNNNQGAVQGFGTNAWGFFASAVFLDPLAPDFLPVANLNVSNCEMNGNASVGEGIGFEIVSVPTLGLQLNTNFNILNCVANDNIGGGDTLTANEGEGFVIAGTQNFTIRDCYAYGNFTTSSPSGIAGFFASTGIGVPFACSNGLIENCVAEGNSGPGDVSTGFRIMRSDNITISNCVAIGNNNTSTGEAWGFTTDPNLGNLAGEFGPPVNNNIIFIDCVAESNVSENGMSCGGFKFISQINSTITKCKSIGNGNPLVPNGYGILVSNPDCCSTDTCCIVDPIVCKSGDECVPFSTCCPTSNNVISYNEITGNPLYGIFDGSDSSANNSYFANVARSNGTNFVIPAGNPIRCWPLPGLPSKKDNNGIVDPLDNISITSP